jgi:uncharacterized protein YacL
MSNYVGIFMGIMISFIFITITLDFSPYKETIFVVIMIIMSMAFIDLFSDDIDHIARAPRSKTVPWLKDPLRRIPR